MALAASWKDELEQSSQMNLHPGNGSQSFDSQLMNQDCEPCSSAGDGDESSCRICLLEMNSVECWRTDCLCKGDLALAHRDCALKWFALRGNNSCDVCGDAITNLPLVTLSRLWEQQKHPDEDEEDEDPIDSSWSKIAALIVCTAFEFFWQKLEDLKDFP